MIRTKGEAGTGNVVEAVRHARAVNAGIRKLRGMNNAELVHEAKLIGAPVEVLQECKRLGRLPVVNFAAGGIATPADAALMMQLGVRRRLRRLRHLQVRRPAEACQGDRRRDDLLRQARGARRGVDRVGQRRCTASRSRPSRRTSCSLPEAGSARKKPLIGVLAMQGAFAEHVRALEESGARTRLVRTREDLDGLDGLVLPGGESTTMTMLMERVGLLEPLRERDRARPADACHVRGHDRAREGRHGRDGRAAGPRPARHRSPPQRLRPPGRQLRGAASRSKACNGGPFQASSSARRSSNRPATRGDRDLRWPPRRGAPGPHHRSLLPPGAVGDLRLHKEFVRLASQVPA